MTKFKSAHMVFKVPGTMAVHEGVGYDWMIVEASDVPSHVKAGWHASIVDAKAALAAAHAEPEPSADESDDTPPTRAELEEQCKKLGIKVDGRYSDRRLLALIAEKMG